MPTPDLPRFIPDPTGDTLGSVQLKKMEPGVIYVLREQPPRDRKLILDEKYSLVGVEFHKNPKHPDAADLRDLVIDPAAGQDDEKRTALQKQLTDLLNTNGVETVPLPDRYARPKSNRRKNPSPEDTQAFVTDSVGNPFDQAFEQDERGVRVPRDHRRPRR